MNFQKKISFMNFNKKIGILYFQINDNCNIYNIIIVMCKSNSSN